MNSLARLDPVSAVLPQAEMPAKIDAMLWKATLVSHVHTMIEQGCKIRAACAIVAKDAAYPAGAKRGQPVAARTLRRWVSKQRTGGITELARATRSDTGQRRVALSRKWDAFAASVGVDTAGRNAITARAIEAIIGEWQAGAPSARRVVYQIRADLIEWTASAALAPLGKARAFEACLLPESLAAQYQHHQTHDIAARHAQLWSDKYLPRITRNRRDLKPMQWLAGDVHHMDVVIQLDGGALGTPELVAWQCLATNRLFVSLYILPRRRNIQQKQVLESLSELTVDANWGIPDNVYLDNGREYLAVDLAADMLALKRQLPEGAMTFRHRSDAERAGIIRSAPYAPQGKIIENFFGRFEQSFLSQMPGYIGGDRLNKRTEKLGEKYPTPWQLGEDELRRALATALECYHAQPQAGHLDGRSPNQAFADAIADGWQSVIFNASDAEIAFSKEHSRVVDRGVIEFQKRRYYADELLMHTGQRITLRAPIIGTGQRLYVFDASGSPLAIATMEREYKQGSGAGAEEQKRRTKVLAAMLEASTVPARPDRLAVMRREANIAPTAPRASAAATVSVHNEFADMAARQQVSKAS